MKTLLFVTTEPSLTGAPLYLLNHLRQLKTVSDYNYIIIFIHKTNGITDEFKKIATVYFWEDILSCGFKLNKLARFIHSKTIRKSDFFNRFVFRLFHALYLKKHNIVSVIANSSTIDDKLLHYLKGSISVPVIMIVHEGEKLLREFNKDGTIDTNFANSDRFIAVSEYLKNILIDIYKVKKEITVITGAVGAHSLEGISSEHVTIPNIPLNAKVVMSSGWLSWHKGADFFIQIAIQVLKSHPDVHFCWVGDASTVKDLEQFNFDIEKAEITANIHHIASNSTPLNYFNRADIFLMLSRNESFSLVTIEACSLRKPVLCFEKVGGPNEILNHDSQLILPYGNTNMLSKKIVELLENDKLRQEIGKVLFDRVTQKYTLEKTSLQFQEILNSTPKAR